MEFTVHGPFKLPRQKGLIDRRPRAKRAFWEAVDKDEDALASACGCYVYVVRAGKGMKPWYVGLTHKQTFRKECLTHHKINIYNDAIANRKGNPMLFLLAKRTTQGRFAKASIRKTADIRVLEGLLIGSALDRNPGLGNVARTRVLQGMIVPGFINSPKGRPGMAAIGLRKTLFKR